MCRLNKYTFAVAQAAFEDDNYVHIVMDLCQGGHLLEWLETNGPLNERTAARLTVQMAEMLCHFHDLNIMHRDIKPENFLLTEQDIEVYASHQRSFHQ